MNITNILQTLFSRLVILTLAVVFLSGCNPEEVLDDGGYEIKLLSTESVFREGEQLSVGVFDKVTGEQDVSANISSNNQSFELDEYVWTTDNSDLAEMALEKTYKNQIITKAPGKVVITATNSKRQVSFELTIAPALLNSVVISPKAQSIYLGQNKSFVVNGNYSDGSVRPITEGISWSIDNNDRASITNQGVVSSLNVGLVKVTASVTNELQQVKTNAVNLTITEAAVTKLDITAQSNIPLGRTGQVSAIAQFTDLTNDNVTTNVSWISTPENIINIDAEGNITTNNMGQVTVSAVIDDGYGTEVTSNSVEITISEKVIETIDIVPENQVILKDAPVISIEKQEQFTVEATYSTGDKEDISLNESLVFTSSDTSIATVALLDSGQFLIETFVEGTTTLTLSLPNRLDEQIVTERVLTVIKPVLTKIVISAQSDTFAVGLQVNWQAIGHYDDNTTKDISDTVTWSSSSSNLASFNQDKRSTLSVTDTGVTSITAQFINDREQLIVSEPAEVTLRSAIVVDVLTISDNANIIDGQVSVPQGVQVNFQLKGMLSDGTEQILSGVTWTATENELATLDSSSGILIATKDVSKLGVLTTTASIFIDDTNFSHDVIVTVTPAKLVSFAIELPENNGLYKGYSQPLKVMGTFSTDLTYDLTDVVTWEINEASKDKIVLSSIKLNTLEMVNAGDVTVSASYLDIYDENKTKTTSLNFTVAPALLTSMSISAQLDSDKNGVGELDVVSVASGQNVLFSAIGTYSDNSTKEITEQVTWLSSSPSFLTIIETGEDGGQANTFEPTLENTALTISALLTNDKQEDISSTFSFTIGDAVLENINLSPAALSFGLNVPAGKSVQLEIWGTYSDGSYKKITEDNAAVWSSNNLEIGTIVKETGLVTMEKGDPAALLITATETVSGNSFKGSLVLNRVDAIVEFIKITPDTSSAPWKLADGAQLNLKAFAVYSDLSEVEITEDENSTWSIPDVSDQAFISVENGSTFKGLVTALTETENKVTVNLQNTTFGQTLTTTADFVIGAAVLEFIEVSPTIQTITSGDTLVFTATGFTSNDETIDLTELATWSSQNINVAEFNQASSNVLQGISAGSVYITASYTPTGQEELTSETQVTVEPAILRSISIHPTSPRFTEIPQNTPLFLKGNTDLLTATGLYSDGTTATINGSVDWSIDNTNVAYISSVGVITPVGLGDATLHVEIEVVELGETKTIYVDYPFTVIGPLLKFIDITPATPVFVLGMQQQFTAKGIYSDNSIVDLTNAVTWTTGRSNELAEDKAGNITNTGVFSAERLGSVTVNASHPDFDDKAIIKQTFVSIETLDHLVIEHAGGDVYAGQKLSLNAYGVTSNNKQVTFSNGLTWQVSAIATIDDITNQSSTNSFTTNAAGVMTATATWTTDVGVTSKSIQIDIKDPLLTSISLSVDDNSIADGLTAQFTATGSYSDGSTQNITDDVSWNNLNESIFTISTTGLITSNQPGSGDVSVYITNESGNKITSASVTITVELPIVQSLTITAPESNNTISRGTSAQLSLTGQLTDGTTDLPSGITWESSNELNAIVTDAGLVSIPNDADLGAIVTIKALVPVKNDANEIIEKTIILTVGSAKLTSLTLTTTDQTVPRGSTAQISAMGLLTDDTAGFPIGTAITWSSSDTNKATVNASNGLVTIISNAVIGQKVTITATSPDADGSSVNITQSIVLTIGKPLLTALSLTTSDTTVPRGTSVTIDATGIQSDSTNGISTTITWTTNKPTLSTVSSSGKVTIRNTAGEDETITITASAAAISGSSTNITQSITLTVDAPLLSSMELSTSDTTIPRGTSNAYITATGTYTDTTTKDDPDSLTWSSGNTDIATVDVNGFITILNNAEIGEQVIVTATAPIEEDSATNVTKTITLTVGQPLLTSMTLAALDVTNNEVPGGTSTTITPTGTQSDSTNDIATTITWTTSDASIATVDANGVVTIANGAELNDTVTITATANESATSTNPVTQSILLKVVAPLLSSITLSTDNTTIPRGTTATVSAIGTYTDTSTVDPMTAVWTSSDTAQATVDSSTGVVTIKDDAVIGQQVIITATAPNGGVVSSDIVKTITLTVGQPLLTSMTLAALDVTNNEVPGGTSTTITPTGTQSDSTNDIATTITWTTSDASIATVDANGVVTIANGAELNDTVTITATANESATSTNPVTQSILLKVVAPLLSSITLSTDNTTIPRGTTATVSAIGTYTDTSTVDPMTAVWSSSDTAQATVDSSTGVVTIKDDAVIGQQVIITATAPNGGVVSSDIVKTITLLVGNPVIETLDIVNIDSSVRKGRSLTLTKSIVMSDSDITKVPTLTWSSSNSITATVDNGVVTIPNSATVGHTATIKLRAPKYIGSSEEFVEDSILITVTEAALEAITLTPGDSQVPRGSTIKLVASGLMSDGSSDLPTELTWSTSDSSIATVTDSGDVTIKNDADFSTPDTVVITATADEALLDSSTTISKSVTLTVGEPEVESVDITNSDLTLARGKSLTLTTNVVMSDANPASEPTLTWSSKSPSIVSVAQDGTITVQNNATLLSKAEIVVQTVAFTGSSTIVSDSIFVTVGAPLLTSIALSPGDSDIRVGTSMAFTATGTLSDGTNGLPTTLTWSSDNAKATVSTTGVVTFANDTSLSPTTTATIMVSAPESSSSSTLIEQTVVVTAIAPLVEQIEITVNNVSSAAENVAKGDSLQLGTLTTYSDGTTSTSAAVTWEELLDSVNGSVSSPAGVVTIANNANVGDTIYIAVSTPIYDGASETVNDSIEITITEAILESIEFDTANSSVIQGNTLQVVATGTYTDGTTMSAEDLSSTLTWSTDNPGEVDVSHIDSGLSSAHGLITVAYDAVIADSIITATHSSTNISQSITITVAYPEVDLELSVSNSTFLVEDTLTITPSFTTTSDTISDTDGYDSTQLSWSSSDDSIATVGATTGIVSALAQGSVTITATHDLVTEDSANGVYAVASSPLTATIELTIENPTANLELSVNVEDILLGETLTIAPTFGTSANNSSASTTGYDVANLVWTSSDETVATVASGIVTSLTQGTTTITASLPGIIATANLDDTDLTNNVYTSASALSESAAITVTAPEVVDFDIYAQTSTILVEQTQLVIDPVEIFSDKTTQALTTTLDWSTDDSNIIFTTGSSQTVNAHSGSIVVTSNNLDSDTTATITATHATLGTKTLSVTFRNDNDFVISHLETSSPAIIVPDNSTVQLEAVAIYDDGFIKNITSDADNAWTTNDESSTVINGLVTIDNDTEYSGNNIITSTFSTKVATTTLDIKDATLVSIEVYPQDVEVLAGLNYNFKAYGLYSYSDTPTEYVIADITDSVTWSSDDTSVINNSGKAIATGTATYTATVSGMPDITNTASVQVVSTISNIALTKTMTDVSNDHANQALNYPINALATYPNGHVQNITEQVFWSATSDLIVNNSDGYKGLITPTAYTDTEQTVTASIFTNSGTVSGTTTLNTSSRTVSSIAVTPATIDLGDNGQQQFTATATYSDSSTEDVTELVTWKTDSITSVHISNTPSTKGLLTAKPGSTDGATLTAYLYTKTDTAAITRSNVSATALNLSPDTSNDDVTIAVDGTLQFTVEGEFTSTNTDFTKRVVWTSSDPTKVIISNAAETRGVATRLASGDVTITATYENLSVTSGTIGTTP